jgi:hypothetical protein
MNKSTSARSALFNEVSSGWALPIYINRHPQPPAKYIRFSGLSQSLYTCIVKINNLTCFRDLGYSGTMDIKKAIDAAYLRGQVIALLKLSADIQSTINKLETQIKEGENDRDKLQRQKS